MTDALSGMLGSLWVCATQGGTYVKLGEIRDLSLKIDGKEIDTSNVDDAGWGSSINGAKKFSLAPKGNLLLADAGYLLAIAAMISGNTLWIKALQSGTPTVLPVGFAGPAGVNGTTLVLASANNQQSADWTINGRGALTALP